MMLTRFSLLSLFLSSVVAMKTPVPIPSLLAPADAPSSCEKDTQPLFGVSRHLPSLLSVRGGEVLEPETPDDVQALIMKAGSEQKLVVIDFSATWCGPCKIIAPLFAEFSEAMPNVVFLKIDVDEDPDTAAKYNVSAMPTFLFIKGGEVVDRLMGANPTRLQELIEEHQ